MNAIVTMTAAVPMIFQMVIGRVCHTPGVIISNGACFLLTDSNYPALIEGQKKNFEAVDYQNGEYISGFWSDSSTWNVYHEKMVDGQPACDYTINNGTSTQIQCLPIN